MSREAGGETFLARWSRLKRERPARGEAGAEPAEVPRAEVSQAPADEAPPPVELPDPESLAPDADFSVFLREGVPEALKQKALRRLWRSNPIIRTVDMLDDYCEDFTDAATVVAGLRTAVDKGREAYERLREHLAESGKEEETAGGETAARAEGKEAPEERESGGEPRQSPDSA